MKALVRRADGKGASSKAGSVLRVEELTVSYTSELRRLVAVEAASFDVAEGETFGLVGESGSGKTTTALAILNMIKPPGLIESGRVELNGSDLLSERGEALRRRRWQEISYIPQASMNALNPVMRVKHQLADVLTNHGKISEREVWGRIGAQLEAVGLSRQVAEMYPHELSGGMKQRVCIAMATILRPRVIVADEPTSALDVVVQRLVAETLRTLQVETGAAVILIGHDLALQAQLVDRIAVMRRGRIVELAAADELFRAPLHPYTQLLLASVPVIGHERRTLPTKAAEPLEILPLREVNPGHLAAIE